MIDDERLDLERINLQAAATAGQQRPHAWALIGPDLRVVAVSPDLGSLTRLAVSDVAGRPLAELLQEFVGAEEALAQVLAGEQADFVLDNVQRDDQGQQYLTFLVTRFALDEKRPRLLLVVEDSTEMGRVRQRQMRDRNQLRLTQRDLVEANEALLQLNQQKSLFLAMAAHDLRTPLTSIQGLIYLVRNELPDELQEQRQMLDFIFGQAERLQKMISDLLDLDLIEQGRLAIQRRECVLNDLLRNALAIMGPSITMQSLQLEAKIADEPLVVWADPLRLEQIIYNLLGNALKYSAGGGTITVVAEASGDGARFEVSNEGRPLAPKEIERLFDAYYRTDAAKESLTQGSGLGLYIVRMLLEAHGGTVEVAALPDKGNRFSVYLPGGRRAGE